MISRVAEGCFWLTRYLERVDTLAQFEAPSRAPAVDTACSIEILRSCCAFDPFFRSTTQPLSQMAVVQFLLFDRSFSRSVLYNLDEARTLLFHLRRDDPVGLPRRSRTALERLRGELLQMDRADVERRGVHATLQWTAEATDRLCTAIHDDYLAPPLAWLRHCVGVLESVEVGPGVRRVARGAAPPVSSCG